ECGARTDRLRQSAALWRASRGRPHGGAGGGRGLSLHQLHEIDVPQVKAAREAIGPDLALMCDTNCPWSVPQATEMAQAFKPFDLHWLEEPVWPPEDHDGLAQVRQVGVPIAAGENAAGTHDFR